MGANDLEAQMYIAYPPTKGLEVSLAPSGMASAPLSVVAVGAHPDDVELTCLGTLLRYQELGARVTIVVASDGRAGGQSLPHLKPDEVAEVRRAEAEAVAAGLGAGYVCLGMRDQEVVESVEQRLAMTDVFRAVGADVVLVPPPNDYHADHRVASQLASYAALVSKVGSIKSEHAPLKKSPILMYVEPAGGFGFDPTDFIDITSVFDRKCELLRLHESQMGSMSEIFGVDLVTQVERVNGYRGFQCGVRYAEAFMTAPVWGTLRPRDLPLGQ